MSTDQSFADKDICREALVEQIRNRVLASRSDVVGIILFGSFARDEPYRDVDVLVIVSGPPGSLPERDLEMIALRRAVGLPADVDVLIYTTEEFRRELAYRERIILGTRDIHHHFGRLSCTLHKYCILHGFSRKVVVVRHYNEYFDRLSTGLE